MQPSSPLSGSEPQAQLSTSSALLDALMPTSTVLVSIRKPSTV
jgi:hypothetical protein